MCSWISENFSVIYGLCGDWPRECATDIRSSCTDGSKCFGFDFFGVAMMGVGLGGPFQCGCGLSGEDFCFIGISN
jgi:hypothetical protein